MRIGLVPEFSDAEIASSRRWIMATLDSDDLVQNVYRWPFDGRRLALYVNNQVRTVVRYDYWTDDGAVIHVGWRENTTGHSMPIMDRLAVVGAMIGAVGLWEEFHEQYMAKAARLLIGSYEGGMSGMVRTEAPIRGLALNAEQGVVAGLIGDSFYLHNGTEVQVQGEGWTVVMDRPNVGPVA